MLPTRLPDLHPLDGPLDGPLQAIADLPRARALRDPSGAAVVDGDRRLDNTGLAAAVAELGDAFAAAGVGPGDTVAVMLPNRLEIVVAMFAAWSRGAALTPVNPALTDAEVGHQLDDSGAVLLVADDRGHEVARGRAVAVVHVDDLRGTSGAAPSTTPTVDPGAPALVVYTSGTTGRPKGCVLTHANVDAMVRAIVTHLRLDAADRSLLVLPLFHCNGLLVGVLAPLLAGGSVVVAPRFRPADFWDLVEAERPTYFSAVPTMYALIDAHTERAVDTSSLRFVVCGAAPMPADLIGRFEERFDVLLVEGYGLSECSVAATINPLDERRKPGTVGLPLPGIDVAIASADGEHLPAGERGEVLVRGATVMAGYLHRPEETAATVVDGWLHTGDVGYLDADGFLVLVDRVKDMVIRGGENIYPKEIEDVLYEHPAVLEAAVVGRPDPTYGEVPVAHVALRPGASATPDELRAHCAAVLARFKVPADVQLHAALPKNSVGKLLKPALRG